MPRHGWPKFGVAESRPSGQMTTTLSKKEMDTQDGKISPRHVTNLQVGRGRATSQMASNIPHPFTPPRNSKQNKPDHGLCSLCWRGAIPKRAVFLFLFLFLILSFPFWAHAHKACSYCICWLDIMLCQHSSS